MWLEKYMENEWPSERRGKFPIDLMAWIWERIELEDKYVFECPFNYRAEF
jgi:hypothetical protein